LLIIQYKNPHNEDFKQIKTNLYKITAEIILITKIILNINMLEDLVSAEIFLYLKENIM
jgi:hypothetical protein